MKPSEVVRSWMLDPAYNPDGERLQCLGNTTHYLCCVTERSGLAEGMSGDDARATRRLIEIKLKELSKQFGKTVGVLNHYFECRGITQTLENSRQFWESFAKELEAQGK